jgi:hypothetical protein
MCTKILRPILLESLAGLDYYFGAEIRPDSGVKVMREC